MSQVVSRQKRSEVTTRRQSAPTPAPERAAERISRYDSYMADQRKKYAEAKHHVDDLDVEIAKLEAELQALIIERSDWAAIQNTTAATINSKPPIDGQASRKAPELTEHKNED